MGVVSFSYAIVQPFAMVVKLVATPIASSAMFSMVLNEKSTMLTLILEILLEFD
jgi:hypothetical protein